MSTKDRMTGLTNVSLADVPGWQARAFGIVAFFVGWAALASVFPNDLMPFPDQAVLIAVDLVASGAATEHVVATLSRIFWGFLIAMILGIQVGVFMGLSDFQRKFMTPHIIIGLSAPLISWGVVATLIFGFDILAPIVATVLTAFPFIALNVWKGVENLDVELLEMGSSFEASKWRVIRRIVLPSIAPSLFTAFRFGLALSWKIVTITEIFASSKGIGYQIIQAYGFVKFDLAWGWAIIFMAMILVIEYGIISPLQRRVLSYREDADISVIN